MKTLIIAAALLCAPSVASALTCQDVKNYVDTYGEYLVTRWALSHGYSAKQINYLKRVCLKGER